MNEQDYKNMDSQFNLLTKLVEEKFNGVNDKFNGINQRLDKINGSVQRHEQEQNDSRMDRQSLHEKIENNTINHVSNCPFKPKIEELEFQSKFNVKSKHLIITSLSLVLVVLSIIYTTFKLNETTQEAQTIDIEKIIEPLVVQINANSELIKKLGDK